jgi:hypothetical protein
MELGSHSSVSCHLVVIHGTPCQTKQKLLKCILDIDICIYITERSFRIKEGEAYSDTKGIKSGELQGSVLGPVLFLLYTSDLPTPEDNTIATFADDTAVLAARNSYEEATEKLEVAVNQINYRKKVCILN